MEQKIKITIASERGRITKICFPDLKTMTDRLKARYYVTRRLFIADMTRIFTNCRLYNSPDTEYYRCANALEKYFQTRMKEIGFWDK